jgi:hypothetical protein
VTLQTSFPQDFADGYNGVKHANRPASDPNVLLELYRTGVKVLRVWVALRLGVAAETMVERIA